MPLRRFLQSGCYPAASGGGEGSLNSDSVYFSGPDDTLTNLFSSATSLDDAVTFKADVNAMVHDWENSTHMLMPDQPVSLKLFRPSPTAVPTLVIEAGERQMTFGPEHVDDDGEDYFVDNAPDERIWAWASGRGWLGHANGFGVDEEDADFESPAGRIDPVWTKYHLSFGFYVAGEDNRDLRYEGVIGIETPPGDMPRQRTAYFDGGANIRVFSTGNEYHQLKMDSDIHLTADFATGMLHGSLVDWEIWDSMTDTEEEEPGTKYELVPTAIDGNGFSTSLVPDCDCPHMPNSLVSGKFYGPHAAEAGGTIVTGEFMLEGQTWIGIGRFRSTD